MIRNDIPLLHNFNFSNNESGDHQNWIDISSGTEQESVEISNLIRQSLRLLELVKTTKIDMTERERSLLDLLLKQSSLTEQVKGQET